MILSNVILFMQIFNHTMYITKPNGVSECYITVDYHGDANDSWPDNWIKMDVNRNSTPRTCNTLLREHWDGVFAYSKIKFIYPNRTTYQSSEWKPILYDINNFNKTTLIQQYYNECLIVILGVLFSLNILYFLLRKPICILINKYRNKNLEHVN